MPLFRYAAIVLLFLYGGYAQAAPGDTCTVGGMPGTEDASSACVAVPTPDYGISCAAGTYYNGTSCVAAPAAYASCSNTGYYYDGASCVANPTSQYLACQSSGATSSTHFFNGSSCVANGSSTPGTCESPSTWDSGQCATPAVVPTIPTAPSGSLGTAASSLAPIVAPGANGSQQPICVNSAPIIGAGMIIIAGSTLCYGTAADLSSTSIYAYHTDNGASHGGVIQTNTWNGLNVQDLFAQGNITALGQLSVYGGAQIYSPDGNSGVVVVNGQVLSASSNGSNVASHAVTPTGVISAVTDGTATTSQTINAGQANIASNNGSNSGSLTVASNQLAGTVTDGTATTSLKIEADKAGIVSTDGGNSGTFDISSTQATTTVIGATSTANQTISASQASTSVRNGSGLSSVSSTADKTSILTQSGLGANPTDYTSIDSSTTQIINRANSGNSYTQTTASSGNYIIEASNSVITSRVNVDSSNINLISGYGGTMATNGTTGTTSGIGSGAMQIHQSSQAIGQNATIGNLLAGKTYQNKVNGNLFVDGNVYINGTLEYVSSNAATTTVTSTAGSSILGASLSTSGGTAVVMKDTDATHATVDQNGKIALTPGVSAQSSSAMTLTNGYGNTHGFIVNETQATMSGGINSSSMTLNDNGATFSNSATGMPIQVHGVADGTADFDAVNVRQLRQTREQLAAGIAGISAMSNIPNVDTGKKFSLGAGVGHYQNATSLAIGSSFRVNPNTVIRATVAGTDGGSSRTTTYGLGVGVSW